MGKTRAAVGILIGGALVWVCGCGGGGEPPDPATVLGGGKDGGTTTPSPWTELNDEISVAGGTATTSSGQATAGGDAQLISNGGVAFDKAQAVPGAGDVPTPDSTMSVKGSDLAADVTRTGTTTIEGNVTTGGSEGERAITVDGGDLYIRGTLRSADLGGARQSLKLTATGGTVYIVGTVDTSGAAVKEAGGQAGGAITINAQRIVVVGKLSSAGGGSTGTAGSAGPITLTATDSVFITGSADSFGGDANGMSSTAGGRGGDLTIAAGADLVVNGKVRVRGGAVSGTSADAVGGAAGALTLDAGGGIFLGGTIDGRGGLVAGAATGPSMAGAAGNLRIGTTKPPAHIGIVSALVLAGGTGNAIGGKGGAVTVETHGGLLLLASDITVDGGDSRSIPGAGGTITTTAGHDSGTRLSGRLSLNGGSIAMGSGNGAEAGTITLTATSLTAPLTVETSGEVYLDGGESGGTGVAGGGGKLYFFTLDASISMAGKLYVRGGTAPDDGGTGGLGGAVDIFCDKQANGYGGNLTIEPEGFIDASGGPGTIGGSGRNDGGWGIALFPEEQEQISVLLNSDGIHGTPKDGVLLNLGTIITKGAPGDGWGGDVMFHGRGTDTDDPLPGHVEADGAGKGQIGQVGME
jgi:hypothetical protein